MPEELNDNLPINEFKLDMMVENPSIVMVAKRGSGKSYVCRAILRHFASIPCGLIIAPTDKMNCFYGNFFPDSYIHYDYKSVIIEKLLFRQDKMIEKEQEKKRQGKHLDPRAFIVMDDCLSKKGSWMRDQPIQDLLFNGRHFKLMYILTMQYPLGITPELRSNFDYIFLLAEDFVSNLKRLYDNYAGMFPTFDMFRQVFVQLTANFGSMVIANRGAREHFLQKIFYYKAPAISDDEMRRCMGCRQFNVYHQKNYDPDWRRKEKKSFDPAEFAIKHKRDKTAIKVDKLGDEFFQKQMNRNNQNGFKFSN
jgi:hypothetical protein